MKKLNPFRRAYLVEKRPQLEYAAAFSVVSATVLIGVLVAFLSVQIGALGFGTPDPESQLLNPKVLRTALLRSLWLLVPLTVIAFTMGIIFSNRTFGPLARFRAVLEDYARGNFSSRVHLRKHDHLRELADLINQVGENQQRGDQKGGPAS